MASVLIIDDKEETRLKLQLMLEAAKHQVETVAGPAHANVLLRANGFDVILVDLNDPFESPKGQESLGFFKRHYDTEHQSILIPMTAWPSGQLMQVIQTMGRVNFIEKPLKQARVLQVIEQELMIIGLQAQNQKLTTTLDKLDSEQLPMMPLEQAEKQLIKQALSVSDNNVMKAAKLLGLTKSSLYRRLEKFNLSKPSSITSNLANHTQH